MEQRSVHFVGIGGIGMSAMARILLARGERVSGSDSATSPLIERLRSEGAVITVGHAAANTDHAASLVVSSAIDMQNPEYLAAQERGIPIFSRGQMLARLMEEQRGIAICGTHGKTTTTAMTACVLRGGGIDASLVLGGIAIDTGTNAHQGSAPWFLTEADESDGSFALLDPAIAVLGNIENDHLESDAELPKLVASFEGFLERLPADGLAIVGIDNPNTASLAARKRQAHTLTFGFSEAADVRPRNVTYVNLGSDFEVFEGQENLGSVHLRVPGRINVENAVAAVCVGRALQIPFARIAEALHDFSGVRRRFDIVARSERLTVVDDYAHHPTAIRATIDAAKQYHRGPIVVAFQPHRYSRTAYLARDFADALQGADCIYLTPIYAASEKPIDGISERSIGEPLARLNPNVRYVPAVEDLPELLLRDAPAGALILFLGAGSITHMAARLGRELSSSAMRA
ncbi:MAG: UDP-N-acetylmuramate--L-alanine ligase [Candidatus Eremiobacteraeota bacterium]|nr:UDP-N-acetylmuramate--L-alanine ligase [Candidatus Eremiobacteraeota bacterium]